MTFRTRSAVRVSVLAVTVTFLAAAAAGAIAVRLDNAEQNSLVDQVSSCQPNIQVDAPTAWWPNVRNTIRVAVNSVPAGASARVEFQSDSSGASITPAIQPLQVKPSLTSACGTATAEFKVTPASQTWNRSNPEVIYRIVIDDLPGDSLSIGRTAHWTDDAADWVAGSVTCDPYLLVALRGSGSGWTGAARDQVDFEVNSYSPEKPQSSDHELYQEMRSLFLRLGELPALHSKLGFIASPSYEARPVSFTDSYFKGMITDAPLALARTLRAAALKCPDSRFILGGFSQGAYIAHRLAATIEPDIANRVIATVALGDPARGLDSVVGRGMPTTRKTVGIFAGASRVRPFADDYAVARARCLAVSTFCTAPSLKTFATLAVSDVPHAAAFSALPGRADNILSTFVRGDWVADAVPSPRQPLNSGGIFGPALAICESDYAAPTSSGWKNCETAMAAATRDGNAAHSSYSTSNWLDIAAAFVAARL